MGGSQDNYNKRGESGHNVMTLNSELGRKGRRDPRKDGLEVSTRKKEEACLTLRPGSIVRGEHMTVT